MTDERDPADDETETGDGTAGRRERTRGLATEAVHAGAKPDPATGARATPLYQTTNYVFEDAATAADLYALEAEGDIYSRISNPTVRTLEERLAALEGGTGAVATASGMAALDAALYLLAAPGDNVVAASDAYGGTTAYLSTVARRRGVEARFVDTLAYDQYAAAIDDDTAVVHVETLANPSLVTPDLERLGELCAERGVPLLVDNTFAPAIARPLEHADLVWSSTTKWIHGGGSTIGGVLVDGGSFPWAEHADSYPEVAGPNPAFDGLRFTERFPEAPFAAAARHRSVRSLGTLQSPFDAWVTLQGVQSLPLRMERHCENAARVADFLADHPAVDWVTYPGLADHPTHENATRYLDGYGGVVAFGPAGGYDAARELCESVDLVSFLANVGDAKSIVVHPASTTHAQLSPEEQAEAGVLPELLRLSVGIEDSEDVIADLDRALSA